MVGNRYNGKSFYLSNFETVIEEIVCLQGNCHVYKVVINWGVTYSFTSSNYNGLNWSVKGC